MISRVACLCLAAAALAGVPAFAATPPSTAAEAASAAPEGKIAPYTNRFGRQRPLIAVVGDNGGTELTDFMIPYGVLARAGVAELVTLATRDGVMTMRPAMQIQSDATIGQFDARFPDGADYVIVPAMVRNDEPAMLNWLVAQAAKGATLVSICDGALVLANSGLLKGRRATAHWATEALRAKAYPDTRWEKNTRYVVDGTIVSSAGISAAMPTSLALVEAIGGYERAAAVARELGVADWSTRHDSDVFQPRFGVNLSAHAATFYTNGWLHAMDRIGVPVAPGVDEIALALTADAYSRTGRSRAYALAASAAPVKTRYGVIVVPDLVATGRVAGAPDAPGVVLPAFAAGSAEHALDKVLAGIADRYGRKTAFGVALAFEYPDFQE